MGACDENSNTGMVRTCAYNIAFISFVGEPTGERPIGHFALTVLNEQRGNFQDWGDWGEIRDKKMREGRSFVVFDVRCSMRKAESSGR